MSLSVGRWFTSIILIKFYDTDCSILEILLETKCIVDCINNDSLVINYLFLDNPSSNQFCTTNSILMCLQCKTDDGIFFFVGENNFVLYQNEVVSLISIPLKCVHIIQNRTFFYYRRAKSSIMREKIRDRIRTNKQSYIINRNKKE